MKKANTGITNLSNLKKLAFALPPISNAERARRRNNRLRAAAQRQSAVRAAAKRNNTPSPTKANAKSPNKPKNKSPSPRATIHPPTAFRGAIAHSVAPNGSVYYLIPAVPTGRNYNFGRRVPWANVGVSRR